MTERRGRLLASGVRRTGEPLYETARRLLREQLGAVDPRPWAVDLSTEPVVFGCAMPGEVDPAALQHEPTHAERGRTPPGEDTTAMCVVLHQEPEATIAFRPMTRADFADVVRWQQQPHVARWWHDENPDVATAERNYGPALDGRDPTRMWVLELNARSVGFVQDYRVGDHPEYALLTAEPDAIGFDYAIGDPYWIGRGIGTRVLWTFLRDVVRPHYPSAPTFFAAPDHRNAASLRVLDKLGFEQGLWFDEPQPDGRVDTVVSCRLAVSPVFG